MHPSEPDSPLSVHRDDLPSSPVLFDNYGRQITYLRLAITDRCNLRCCYCMPEQGIKDLVAHQQTLSYEELQRLVAIFLGLGVTKVRVTGGEPFARRDCMRFLRTLKEELRVPQLYLTTNGVETWRHMEELQQIGLSGINLSLDTLDQARFATITRRDHFDRVMATLNQALAFGMPIKINSVVLADTTDEEIASLAELTKNAPLSVRFIELMPFSGKGCTTPAQEQTLAERLTRIFPQLRECNSDTIATARLFAQPGYRGTLGIIEGSSRKFCATCNKVRITPRGMLKACLYDNGVLDLFALLRGGADDDQLSQAIRVSLARRHRDGHETEKVCSREEQPSMASIGG